MSWLGGRGVGGGYGVSSHMADNKQREEGGALFYRRTSVPALMLKQMELIEMCFLVLFFYDKKLIQVT